MSCNPSSSSTAILGKRKRSDTTTSLVLHLSGGSCSSESDDKSTNSASTSDDSSDLEHIPTTHIPPNRLRKSAPMIVNGKLIANPTGVRRFACTFEGCTKLYSKPSRLEEHERSHTGERPFICTHEGCAKSYLRESHLHAHSRSHLSPLEKPFFCSLNGCGKRYWTAQHLRRHSEVHSGEKPFRCEYSGCSAGFMKHNQLRGHIAATHGAQGSKTFKCEHNGCEKAFATSQKLRAHKKVHDERRYTCSHRNCSRDGSAERPYFRTWTDLQAHIRSAHPATCPYPSCNGRTFNAQKNLKAHLKVHEQREADKELYGDSDADDESESSNTTTKRRRGGETGRDWVCEVESCGKDFKSKKALRTHHHVAHLNERNFSCTHPGCDAAYGYKHVLQRHTAKAHGTLEENRNNSSDAHTPVERVLTTDAGILSIDIITGKAYADCARSRLADKNNTNLLQCPHPHIPAEFSATTFSTSERSDALMQPSETQCVYVFSRAYDLHRHLRSTHGLEIGRNVVDAWVCEMKATAASN